MCPVEASIGRRAVTRLERSGRRIARWAAVVGLAGLGACDAVTAPTTEVAGAALFDADGREVARFEAPSSVSGGLSVAAGESESYRVRILTVAGDVAPVDGMRYDIREPGVLIGFAADISIQNRDRIVITGREPRATSIRFQIYHNGEPELLVIGIPLTID